MEQIKNYIYSNKSDNLKQKDLRLLLQEALTERCERNPKYSLRAFAQSLAISPAALSAILNNKRPISSKMHYRLGLKLGLSLEELNLIPQRAHGNRHKTFEKSEQVSPQPQQIAVDTFNVISEPHHYALMELVRTHDFKNNHRWMAQRLGITTSEVNFAIQRLVRVGLLHRDEQDNLIDSTSGFTTDLREGLSTQAQRRVQIKSLNRAIQAVEEIPVEDRDNTAITMAIKSEDLPKAKMMLKEFRRSFCNEMEASTPLDEVYQLTLSFVPLTKKLKSPQRK